MFLSRYVAHALLIAAATAFKDTSPFFLFSTSELLTSSPNFVSSSDLSNNVIYREIGLCPSDTYIIVNQPGVNVADFRDRAAAPHLRKNMMGGDKTIRSSLAVSDVLGKVDADALRMNIEYLCGASHVPIDASTGSFTLEDENRPRVIDLNFPPLPTGAERAQRLIEHDTFLASIIDVSSSDKYTVMYTTSPPSAHDQAKDTEPEAYDMDQPEAHDRDQWEAWEKLPMFRVPVNMELKRDLSLHKRASDGNITLPEGPLFERYQYLTPGLFMGLLVSFVLISILYVGITGIASLQVSYAAFDKEMGPQAQKKAQ